MMYEKGTFSLSTKAFLTVVLSMLLYISTVRFIGEVILSTDYSSLWKTGKAERKASSLGTLKSFVLLDPVNAEYLHLLSYALLSHDPQEAQKYSDRAVYLSPSDPRHWILGGWIKASRGQLSEGYRDFENALYLDPTRPDSFAQKGLFIAKVLSPLSKDAAKTLYTTLAELDLSLALNLDPTFSWNAQYALTLAELYETKGRIEEARRLTKDLIEKGEADFRVRLKKIFLDIESGRYLSAIYEWDRLVAAFRQAPSVLEAVEAELRKYDRVDGKYFLASLAIMKGRYDEALRELTALLKRRGQVPEYNLEIARVYEKKGEKEKACEYFQTVLSLSPQNAEATQKLVECYAHIRQRGK